MSHHACHDLSFFKIFKMPIGGGTLAITTVSVNLWVTVVAPRLYVVEMETIKILLLANAFPFIDCLGPETLKL